jgi:hypothetical protein
MHPSFRHPPSCLLPFLSVISDISDPLTPARKSFGSHPLLDVNVIHLVADFASPPAERTLSKHVLSAYPIGTDALFIHTMDNRLQVLDGETGKQLQTYDILLSWRDLPGLISRPCLRECCVTQKGQEYVVSILVELTYENWFESYIFEIDHHTGMIKLLFKYDSRAGIMGKGIIFEMSISYPSGILVPLLCLRTVFKVGYVNIISGTITVTDNRDRVLVHKNQLFDFAGSTCFLYKICPEVSDISYSLTKLSMTRCWRHEYFQIVTVLHDELCCVRFVRENTPVYDQNGLPDPSRAVYCVRGFLTESGPPCQVDDFSQWYHQALEFAVLDWPVLSSPVVIEAEPVIVLGIWYRPRANVFHVTLRRSRFWRLLTIPCK